MKQALFMIAALLLGSLACQAVAGGQPSTPQLLFEDDFDFAHQKNWEIFDFDDHSAMYQEEGNKFRIAVKEPQMDAWSTVNQDFGQDVIVEVEATYMYGASTNDYGVLCRHAKTKDSSGNFASYFYYFLVGSQGTAVIAKMDNNQQTYMSASGDMEPAAVVKTELYTGTNHIRAECIGNRLTLIVNGQQVASVTDAGLPVTGGGVGLIAGTFDEAPLVILFDNFKVFKP